MERQLIFSTSTELVRVPARSVVCITADGNYSVISTADNENFMLTLQLGQIERAISTMVDADDTRFIRIGKSLIINRDYVTRIDLRQQRLLMSDCHTFRRELSASRDALKQLKELTENSHRS